MAPLVVLSLILFFVFVIVTIVFYKIENRTIELSRTPKVTILKPVMGLDDELETNIESFYLSDYPDFEVIFGVETINDPCVKILEQFKNKYPLINTHIIETGREKEMNPKIETLAKLTSAASGEIYWVADSSTRVHKNTLLQLINEYLTNNSKIVFSPILGTGTSSGGSIMRNSYLNTFVSGSIVTAWKLFKEPIIVGKSMLIEKNALNKLGGFIRFKRFLAEDYMMGEVYRSNNVSISTNCSWVMDYNGTSTIMNFFSKTTRWAKLRYHINKPFYMLEIFTNPIGLSILSFGFLIKEGSLLILFVVLFKILLEYLSLFFLNSSDSKKLKVLLIYPFCIILKDLLLLIIYFIPLYDSTVAWRRKIFVIGSKSKIEERVQ
jgi:ceramide glucosyltransferase